MTLQTIQTLVGELINQNPDLKKMIKTLSVFGSHANGKATEESDIDFLVEFLDSENVSLFDHIGLLHVLEDGLETKVDLCTSEMLSKYFRDDVLSHAKKIYG